MVDSTAATFEFHLMGPHAADVLSQVGANYRKTWITRMLPAEIGGSPVRIIRESPAGTRGLTVIGDQRIVLDSLPSLDGYDGPGPSTQSIKRLLTPANRSRHTGLRQGRDRQEPASGDRPRRPRDQLVKGCYLGQETVVAD